MDKSQVIKIVVAVVLLIVALSVIIWYLTAGPGASSSKGGAVMLDPAGAVRFGCQALGIA